jgi:hypothetical protein
LEEIADYEVRRELLRAGKDRGLARLDALKAMLGYAPVTTPVMLKAAEFWATVRRMGQQSADDASLDADMIPAAQAAALNRGGDDTVIATTNVRHLSLFASARYRVGDGFIRSRERRKVGGLSCTLLQNQERRLRSSIEARGRQYKAQYFSAIFGSIQPRLPWNQ